MKQKFVLALSSFVLIVCLSGCCRPEIIGSVPNTLRPQETNNWCWAATTQMLAEYLGLSVTQCALANQALTRRIVAPNKLLALHVPRRTTAIRRGGLIWILPGPSPRKVGVRYLGILLSRRFIVQ